MRLHAGPGGANDEVGDGEGEGTGTIRGAIYLGGDRWRVTGAGATFTDSISRPKFLRFCVAEAVYETDWRRVTKVHADWILSWAPFPLPERVETF